MFLLGQLLLNLDMRLILGRHHLLLVLHRLLYGLVLDKDSFRMLLLNYGLLLNWLLCGLLLNKNLFRLSLLLDNGLLLNWRLHWLHVLHWLLVLQGRRWWLRILCLNRLCLLLVTQGSSRIVNFNLNRDGTILRDKRDLLLLFFPVLVFFNLALLLVGGHVFQLLEDLLLLLDYLLLFVFLFLQLFDQLVCLFLPHLEVLLPLLQLLRLVAPRGLRHR